MVTKEIKIDSEIVLELQRLSVEVESRRSLIAYMINNDMNITTERYQQYETDYSKFYLEYEMTKSKLEKEIIIPKFAPKKVFKWNLDFNTEIATVEIEE